MDRADRVGAGVALAGHAALFGALSLGLAASIPPRLAPPPSMEVAFVEEIAPESSAPAPAAEMQAAEAPDIGPPEEAAPQPAPVPEPLPVAPAPEPQPAPPAPRPAPQPPVAKAVPRPVAKPAPAKPRPAPPKAAPLKPAPAKSAPAKSAPAKSAPAKSANATPSAVPAKKPSLSADAKAGGAGEKTASRGTRLGKNFLSGLSDPSPAKSDKPAAPAISKDAMAAIVAAIKRQVQPCANRQVNPGPGANRISVRLQLRLNRDGSLASAPKVVSSSGVDDENSRYAKRVADLAIAAYTGCAPMRGLPEDLYKTAKGGWNNVAINYKLPG